MFKRDSNANFIEGYLRNVNAKCLQDMLLDTRARNVFESLAECAM